MIFTNISDRLYTLSFKRFSRPITYNSPRSGNSNADSITRLQICLDNDVDIVTGVDPLSSSQARRQWHTQRNNRIAEAAQTMYPEDMFHDDEIINSNVDILNPEDQ
jgi:hypothetical protein